MKEQNLLIIMSDQHTRGAMGCYSHPLVKTPNLDRLAREGARFTCCSTPSPVCIPARASFATGKYIPASTAASASQRSQTSSLLSVLEFIAKKFPLYSAGRAIPESAPK